MPTLPMLLAFLSLRTMLLAVAFRRLRPESTLYRKHLVLYSYAK